jgi:hypothetical protein
MSDNMFVFYGYCSASISRVVSTPPVGYTTRINDWSDNVYEGNTTYLQYIADEIASSQDTYVSATMNGISDLKHAFLVALRPDNIESIITFKSAGNMSEITSSIEIPALDGVENNDIILAFIHARRETVVMPTINAPSGWNLIFTNTTYRNFMRFSGYWKRANDEPASYIWSTPSAANTKLSVALAAYSDCRISGSPIISYSDENYQTDNNILRAAPIVVAPDVDVPVVPTNMSSTQHLSAVKTIKGVKY